MNFSDKPKIIQSFWSKPLKNLLKGNKSIKGNWLSTELFLMSIALSMLQLKKFYSKVNLITDDFGTKLLNEILGLPYTSVSLDLNLIESYNPDLWALGG